jgi:hypothetical protein
VDACTWARCDAETSPNGALLPPVTALGRSADRGRLVLPVDRPAWLGRGLVDRPPGRCPYPPQADATDATFDQIRDLVTLLGDDGPVPLFAFDAGYDPIALSAGLAGTRAGVLVRIRSDRVFYTDPTRHRPARWADRGVTATGSPAPMQIPGLLLTPSLLPTTLSTTRCVCRPGWVASQAGPVWPLGQHRRPADRAGQHHPGRGGASAQAHQPSPKPCGCGGPDPPLPILVSAGRRICVVSILSTPTGSPKASWAGPPLRYELLSRPTVGPDSSLPLHPTASGPRPDR